MPEANVETAYRWLEAISNERFDAALALVHPDVLLVPPGGQPPYRGAESMRRWMLPDAFERLVIEPLEASVATDRSILMKHRARARGRASGIGLDVVSWSVWTFDEDGLITRIEIYLTHEEEAARKAAGTSESPDDHRRR